MTYKFLSLLFFSGACISAFGQELQSPQINQNAIFANPGLAGSKGQTRVCSSAGAISTTVGDYTLESPQQTTTHSNFLISADGLILNKSIGIGGYISNTNYNKSTKGHTFNISQNIDTVLFETTTSSRYSNLNAGIIVAPKFYLYSNTATDKSRFISPALSFGIRESSYKTSSDSTFLYSNAPSASYGHSDQSSYFSLSHISAGILYNTSKGYFGIKVSYLQSSINRFDINGAFVCAHSFYNKKIPNPRFSFNPQLYLAFYLKTSEKYSTNTIQAPHFVNQGVTCNINLDFRYGKLLFGTFLYGPKYISPSLGIMAGLQFASTRVVLNYMQSYVNLNNVGGLYLSVNILLKNKKTSNDSINEN